MTQPIPPGYHSITPIIIFRDSRKAIDFYRRAFGATERFVMPGPGGQGVMHAELLVGDSIIMVSDENPHQPSKSAETLGNSPVSFYLYVKDVDAAFQTALAAGATAQMPVCDMFWGDRLGSVKDPFGHSWMLATHTRDLTAAEIAQAAQAAMAGFAKP